MSKEITEKNAISILNSARPRKGSYDRLQSAFDMAIKALKKQIPKDCKRIGATQLKCICGSVIKLHRYCPYCGQKLDWSDIYE